MRGFIISCIVLCSVIVIVFSSIAFIAFPLRYKNDIRDASAEFGVDAVLIASVILAESRFRTDAVSSKGAVGLMQIMPQTARFIASQMNIKDFDLRDARTNIFFGTFYLRYLLDKFEDTRTTLMAYNAGEGRVRGWLDGAKRLETTPFPETNAYVERVLNAKNFYRWRM